MSEGFSFFPDEVVVLGAESGGEFFGVEDIIKVWFDIRVDGCEAIIFEELPVFGSFVASFFGKIFAKQVTLGEFFVIYFHVISLG